MEQPTDQEQDKSENVEDAVIIIYNSMFQQPNQCTLYKMEAVLSHIFKLYVKLL